MIKGGKDSGTREFLKSKCQLIDRTKRPELYVFSPKEQDLSKQKSVN